MNVAVHPASHDAVGAIIQDFADTALFADASPSEMYIVGNPYRRPTRLSDNTYIDYSRPLRKEEITSNESLATHRLLLNIYEIDCLFLPDALTANTDRDRHHFYGGENQRRADLARPFLERKAFSFLEEEIEVTGHWSTDSVMTYFQDFLQKEDFRLKNHDDDNDLLCRLLACSDPDGCAKHYLIQLASDFLSEASAMARFTPGNYGTEQSELFNILIDEYGRAVHKHKHSRLFENLVESVGLSREIHRYWQFYQASSLMLTNYFHFLGRNKANYFRYLGALFFTEASLANTCAQQARALRKIFGSEIDVTYFTEHAHIDTHHGAMALDRLIRPTLDKYGAYATSDIIRGFEEFKLLQVLADRDLREQIDWVDQHKRYGQAAHLIWRRILSGELDVPKETFIEGLEERSTTHVHEEHRLVVIETGEMNFWPAVGDPIRLSDGDAHVVPRHRLHGSVITSRECIYHQPIVSDEILQRALADARNIS